jgi:hypothetical protein
MRRFNESAADRQVVGSTQPIPLGRQPGGKDLGFGHKISRGKVGQIKEKPL